MCDLGLNIEIPEDMEPIALLDDPPTRVSDYLQLPG